MKLRQHVPMDRELGKTLQLDDRKGQRPKGIAAQPKPGQLREGAQLVRDRSEPIVARIQDDEVLQPEKLNR